MPAQAGIQRFLSRFWIPAFAGMTSWAWKNFPAPSKFCGVFFAVLSNPRQLQAVLRYTQY
jgi:hypothetical protein